MDTNYYWWMEGVIGVLALITLQYVIKKSISKVEKKETKGWHRRLGKIAGPPLSLLIWALIGIFLISVIGEHLGVKDVLDYVRPLRKTAFIGCFAWFFFRWKDEVEHLLLTDPAKKVDQTTVRIVGRLITLAIALIVALIVMQSFGVNTSPLLAFGSIGAASIGFAGKDVIANFCSGIILQISRPFVSGDQIALPEKQLEGHIEEIGWFRTTMRDNEKRAVYLPNNYFSTMLVVNISRITHRRFKQIVKVPLASIEKISLAILKIREMLSQLKSIDTNLPLHVYLKTFGEYACEIEIEAFSTLKDNAEFNRFQQEVLLKVQSILAGMEIPLATPLMTWKQTS